MSFKLKIKFEDKVIARAKGNNMEDFDNVIKDLKRKFGGRK